MPFRAQSTKVDGARSMPVGCIPVAAPDERVASIDLFAFVTVVVG
jgi:hypothetical protein